MKPTRLVPTKTVAFITKVAGAKDKAKLITARHYTDLNFRAILGTATPTEKNRRFFRKLNELTRSSSEPCGQ